MKKQIGRFTLEEYKGTGWIGYQMYIGPTKDYCVTGHTEQECLEKMLLKMDDRFQNQLAYNRALVKKTFDYYQEEAQQTAIYPQETDEIALSYTALGLNGEAGEVAELIKKMIRDDGGVLTIERRKKLEKELGDVLWYVSEVARNALISLSTLACNNLLKLSARKENNTLNGDGDDR